MNPWCKQSNSSVTQRQRPRPSVGRSLATLALLALHTASWGAEKAARIECLQQDSTGVPSVDPQLAQLAARVSDGDCAAPLSSGETRILLEIDRLHSRALAGQINPSAARSQIAAVLGELEKSGTTRSQRVLALANLNAISKEQEILRKSQDRVSFAGRENSRGQSSPGSPEETQLLKSLAENGIEPPPPLSQRELGLLESAGAVLAAPGWDLQRMSWPRLAAEPELRAAFFKRFPEAEAHLDELTAPKRRSAIALSEWVILPTTAEKKSGVSALPTEVYQRRLQKTVSSYFSEVQSAIGASKKGRSWTDLMLLEVQYYEDKFKKPSAESSLPHEIEMDGAMNRAHKNLTLLRDHFGLPSATLREFHKINSAAMEQVYQNRIDGIGDLKGKAAAIIASPACILAPAACATSLKWGAGIGAALALSSATVESATGSQSFLCNLGRNIQELSGPTLAFSFVLAPVGALAQTGSKLGKILGVGTAAVGVTAAAAHAGISSKDAYDAALQSSQEQDPALAQAYRAEAWRSGTHAVQSLTLTALPSLGLFKQAKPAKVKLKSDSFEATARNVAQSGGNTTSLRRETKWVVDEKNADHMLNQLRDRFGERLTLRDVPKDGKLNITETDYLPTFELPPAPSGTAPKNTTKRKAKIRIRRYGTATEESSPHSGSAMETDPAFKDTSKLEFKIDHATEKDVVLKPSVVMKNADIELLFKNPASFAANREAITARSIEKNPPELVKEMIAGIEALHQQVPPDTLQKALNIRYSRSAYQVSLKDMSQSPPKKVDVQITFDRDIQYRDPAKPGSAPSTGRYEPHHRVVEVKIPIEYAKLSDEECARILPELLEIRKSLGTLQQIQEIPQGTGKSGAFSK